MEKDWYDKYGKEFHCADCVFLDNCIKNSEPLYGKCCEQYLRDRIAELEEQLKNAIVPKFKRQEIVYSIEYGEISEIEELQVVAYLDNYIILCENIETSKLDWVHKDYLFATKEEAQAKLEELKGENK